MPTFPTLVALVAIIAAVGGAPAPRRTAHDIDALGALAGEWQSDTVGGVSARSSCAWTARHLALFCEQRIDGMPGLATALNVFTADSTDTGFVLYVVSRPGAVITPVSIAIRGAEWFYGGTARAGDGRWYRTVNDFTQTDSYTWRQETSLDGEHWTSGGHGRSRRIR